MIAEFVINRYGSIEVMMGTHLIGAIEPRPDEGKIGAYYRILLPSKRATPYPATSVEVARRLILQRLADWFGDAGPSFYPVANALALQSEDERAALESPPLFPRQTKAPAR